MTRFIRRRAGFTLVELMVVMALLAFLTALVMLIAPDILAKDRARDGATQIQGALQNARLRAMRDGLPRGVRLIIDPAAPANASNQYASVVLGGVTYYPFVTASSYQYLEVPSWLLFTNLSGTASNPYLQLQYTLGTGQSAGQIVNRTCTIGNLTALQYFQLQNIVNGNTSALPPTLGLPTLNYWTTINPGSFAAATNPPPTAFPYSCTITLSIYPDAMLGGASTWIAYAGSNGPAYFGIYQSPRPLLGEPVINMPVNTTVDVSDGVSQPSFGTTGLQGISSNGTLALPGYDLMFSPSGQLMTPYGAGHAYLWVRDPTKGNGTPIANPNKDQGAFYSMSPYSLGGSYITPQYAGILPAGGEQLLVGIKANSGGTGISPVFWPSVVGQTPYDFATKVASSP